MNIDPFFTIETWKQKSNTISIFNVSATLYVYIKEEDTKLCQKPEGDNGVTESS